MSAWPSPAASPKGARAGVHPAGAAVLAALAVAAVVAAGCGERPHSNPLDPKNPDTGGRPAGFVAVAGYRRVDLQWAALPATGGLAGVRLARRDPGAAAYAFLTGVLPPTSTSYLDTGLVDDSTYAYRLYDVLPDSALVSTPAEALARPGPEVIWVSDPGVDVVVRMTPDGRMRNLTVAGLDAVNRLSVDEVRGELWATEPFRERVDLYAPDGSVISSFSSILRTPNAIAVDVGTRTAWVCDEGGGSVRRLGPAGTIEASAGTFGLPVDVIAPPDGSAWIVDQLVGEVRRVDRNGATLASATGLTDVRRVAGDASDGSVWVTRTSAGEVVHVSPAGAILARYGGFTTPFAIALDLARNTVWVGLDQANAVVGLDRATGAIRTYVGGIARPRGLAVNGRTGEVWVVAIAAHQLVLLAADGTVLARNANFDTPFDVVLDPGPRAPPFP